ncbi:hydrogenase [Candidatus Poribacteria bacterium]|nr:hydrogenase [Candidatus Poribacteria bacterium]
MAFEEGRAAILSSVPEGCRISALFHAGKRDGAHELIAVLADDAAGSLRATRLRIAGDEFHSMTPECPQAHLFEREIAEQSGLCPAGHPWLKPVRFAGGPAGAPVIGVTDFYRVKGDEMHEVAVGPVHAGVIEPGHFRFQCHGENVFHLEISLGYQHRGIEAALVGGPHPITPRQIETAAGDTSIGHMLAYCQVIEGLSASRVPARAHSIRSIALELERLANHTGDLGALAGDVGFLPTMSYCGRIRGDFLNMTALLCGNRFGRSLVVPGGVAFDLDENGAAELRERLAAARTDVTVAVELLFNTPSVLGRFENTGALDMKTATEIGLVGPAARACGLERDVRHDHPSGIYQFSQIPVSAAHYGDVNSRALVRWLEIKRSLTFLEERLESFPAGAIRNAPPALRRDRLAVSLVEGWRGEVCHVAVTNAEGRFARYKIVDPSFHNWFGLALALRDQQISDFPLCNKSFNLSYCGFDL